ncbi:RFX DNA-binding domain-containing protein [Calycina marina]|uniref:RFX DNA-binding domain-containing protein n=1 Tax=Calycina marina TaxID=1763456 RepID=A0A9P8CJT0_9HELO|nr:RFX DNA-binding domain-containing protein [Calycina marina]
MDRPNNEKKRPRSNTATSGSRKRPQSRASTTSANSAPPPAPDNHLTGTDTRKQWYDNGSAHQRLEAANQEMTPEDMVLHSASQLQNPRGFDIDPTLAVERNHGHTYNNPHYNPESKLQPVSTDDFRASYCEGETQLVDGRSDEQDEVESVAGQGGPAKKPSKSSAANEVEMRQLFHSNQHRTLPEIAMELHGNERGPQSERQRQVFAMLWIDQVCSVGKGSVPRGRVYSSYVSRCATERVTVLNPASFGKLVRVLFPGLKTRRLGVRGESKYHYVCFSLQDDQPAVNDGQANNVSSFAENSHFGPSFSHNMPLQQQYPVDTAAFPSPDVAPMPGAAVSRLGGFTRPHSIYSQPEVPRMGDLSDSSSKMPQRLQFRSLIEQDRLQYEPISLPSIRPYVPAGTDPDAADALAALYRSHCTSIIECIRFCKEKTFFHLFQSFHGTLTMPVQKLFAHPSMAPWIEQCDFAMYQKVMSVVAPLTLQVAPKPVLDSLRSISERLVKHIQGCFHGHPEHVVNAKVAPATLFAALLDRELRVNLTAHAAANMLSNPANRNQMYEDWITMVRTRKVAECVPTRGMDDVVNLLLNELRELLDPVSVPWDVEQHTPYGAVALRNGRQQQVPMDTMASTENVLDRWVTFLLSLPARFLYATHAEIVWCVQSVTTAVMRDITIAQGKSFGAWWVTKCWIDEMISFLAEQGGFMEYKSSLQDTARTAGQLGVVVNGGSNHRQNRYSSGSDDFVRENGHMEDAASLQRPMDKGNQGTINSGTHDDSGIGIRTPDDDFSASKYDYARDDSYGHPGVADA